MYCLVVVAHINYNFVEIVIDSIRKHIIIEFRGISCFR